MSNGPILKITNGPSVPATTNYIVNPGFHEDLTGWALVGWSGADALIAVSNERFMFGRQSMYLWAPDTQPVTSILITDGLIPGETYTASCYFYCPSESGGQFVFGLADESSFLSQVAYAQRDSWVRVSATGAAGSIGRLSIYVGTSSTVAGGATRYWVDGVQLEKGDTATKYCDGYENRCRWTGDANASTSKRNAFEGTTINLISEGDTDGGFFLAGWTPKIAEYKDGGIEASSPFADGTRLRHKQFNSVIETFNLRAKNIDSDEIARQMANLRQALEDASDYWVEPFNNTPWWIEARSSCETNTRYAYIQKGSVPDDTPPYSQPFLQASGGRVTDELSLIIQRGHWLSQPPPESEDLTLCSQDTYQTSYALDFEADNNTDNVNCGSNASIDDLPQSANGTTWEAWVKVESVGDGAGGDLGRIFDKQNSRTMVFITTGGNVRAQVTAGTPAISNTTGIDLRDGQWHHVAATYEDTVNRQWRIFVDGVESAYSLQQAAVGALTGDAAGTLIIGNNLSAAGNRAFDGQMSWARLSNTIRYTGTFVPPDRCFPPTEDANTMAQYNFREGTGATLSDVTGTNDGTITGADWVDGCEACTGNRLNDPIVYALEYSGTDYLQTLDAAAIQDLPTTSGGFQVEAWIKYDDISSIDDEAMIANKDNWYFGVKKYSDTAGHLVGFIDTDATDAYAIHGTNIMDGKWHHVEMVYNPGYLANYILMWVDGEPALNYFANTPSTGTYVSDVGDDLYIGNNSAGTQGFVGRIAWLRFGHLHAADINGFVPIPKCSPPKSDTITNLLYWTNEGEGGTVFDHSGNDNHALISGADWVDNCAPLGTAEDPCGCLDNHEYTPAVVTGFHKLAGLTNIHKKDSAGAIDPTNLLGEPLPYNILPDNVTYDELYIGIDGSTFGAGNEALFNNVVFFLTVPYTGTVTWEYYDTTGAGWSAMTAFITGDVNLDKEGLNIIAWPQPAGMTSAASVTGLPSGVYIRATFTAANEALVLQDKQQVYTASQPHLDIVDEFGGDIASLIGMTFVGNGARTVKTAIRTVICGARNLSRGENFQMILPFGDSQLPDNVSTTVSGGGVMSFGATVASPTYTCAIFNPIAVGTTGTATIQIDPPLSSEYTGRFIPILRFWLDENSARSTDVQSYTLEVKTGTTSSTAIYSRTVTPSSYQVPSGPFVQDRHVIWPEIFIDPRAFKNALNLLFEVTVTQIGANLDDVYLTDFSLVPADEMIFQIDSPSFIASVNVIENDDFADVSSIEFQNFGTLARANNQSWYAYVPKYNGPAELSLKRGTRLWFWINSDDNNAVNGGYGIYGVLSTTFMRRVRRYLSLRGDL